MVLGFAEAPVNRLLGVDGERESVVGLVALGRDRAPRLEVTRFFSPHAAGKSYLFVIVFGLRRPRPAQL